MTTSTKKTRAANKTMKAEKAEIRVRLDAGTKRRAEKLFKRQGLSTSDGIRILLDHALTDASLLYGPNAESLKAINESLAGGGEAVTLADLRKQWDEA